MLFSEFKRSKDQKHYKNWTEETVFVYILGFILYGVSPVKFDLNNIWFKDTLMQIWKSGKIFVFIWK